MCARALSVAEREMKCDGGARGGDGCVVCVQSDERRVTGLGGEKKKQNKPPTNIQNFVLSDEKKSAADDECTEMNENLPHHSIKKHRRRRHPFYPNQSSRARPRRPHPE